MRLREYSRLASLEYSRSLSVWRDRGFDWPDRERPKIGASRTGCGVTAAQKGEKTLFFTARLPCGVLRTPRELDRCKNQSLP